MLRYEQRMVLRKQFQAGLTYLILTIFLLVALLPFTGIVLTSFKERRELRDSPFSLPEEWKWDNYEDAWTGARFSTYFKSSVYVVVPVVVIAIILSTMSGFGFGMYKFRGDNILLFIIMLGLMVPFEAVIIPLWQLMGQLGIRDTYWALILPQVALSFSFGTFWMRANFKNIPTEIVDAAVVDGCSMWGVLWRILFPLSRPALVSLVVLLFMWTWNEFFLILVMASGDLRTLPVGLALLRGRYASDVPVMAAGSVMVLLPVLVIYVLFQRQFIRGMISGAVKS
ncbi:MAG: carbohydrate ABC transporter permease [Chloroflexi bacterium]|nr:carbohydrate ABC transporter permease [Chloroflexota bacterium]